jgi:hypothetical protein
LKPARRGRLEIRYVEEFDALLPTALETHITNTNYNWNVFDDFADMKGLRKQFDETANSHFSNLLCKFYDFDRK